MIVPGSAHSLLLSTSGYTIPYSLRFRAANSAYLSRTPASSSSQTTYTFSYWFKRGNLNAQQQHFAVGTNSQNYFALGFGFISGNDQLNVVWAASNVITARRQTNRVFRDPSAWYHVVVALDTGNATANSRVRVYVNGVEETSFANSVNPTQSSNQHGWNTNVANYIGAGLPTYGMYHDGYMAEVNFIDGQALTPSSFGQTDSATGVWVPKKYSGTYGTNGFYLKFADASAATAAAIGKDSSGNGNNWTPSGISVTSGVTFDQMLDTPTLNYAVWSPLDTRGGAVPTNANMNPGVGNSQGVRGTFGVTSGKWYWEHTLVTASTDYVVGIGNQNPFGTYVGSNADSVGYFSASGEVRRNASVIFTYGTWNTSGKVVGFALDQDAGTLQIYVDGVSQGSAFSHSLTGTIFPMINFGTGYGTPVAAINFGQRAFSYTPPTGFKALNTANIASAAVTTSGSFTGNAAADGPFIWANGNPATLTINGNAVTFGTHADKTAGGFKLRTSSASYNTSGTNNWTATAGKRFVQSKKPNNAQVNP